MQHNCSVMDFDMYDETFAEKIIKERIVFLAGLTGGIASGKSFAAGIFENLGAKIVDFDLLAREAVKNSGVLKKISELFGDGIIFKDGGLDRKALGRIVFNDAEAKRKLEDILHPLIFSAYAAELERIIKISPGSVVIPVIPLLFEFNLEKLFHSTVLVYARREQQLSRLLKRDNLDKAHAEAIIASQLPIDSKLCRASMVIYNTGDKNNTVVEAEKAWKALLEMKNAF